jgi:hypothetical protein|tara:strand:+ start:884 stop:1315 length:432 start_codon:yes stop_codon:yes gene_type:complete
MAKFAELDSNNVVLRVLQACNTDVDNNGGEESEQAATHFKSVVPLSGLGVKWVQTSFSASFRKKYAEKGDVYNETLDMFVQAKPHDNFTLNSDGDWISPIGNPTEQDSDGVYYAKVWDETNQRWTANDETLVWNTETSAWDSL